MGLTYGFAVAAVLGIVAFAWQMARWIRQDIRARRVARELDQADRCTTRLPAARARVGTPGDRAEGDEARLHVVRQDHDRMDLVTSSLDDDLRSRLHS